jgi:hypothetical protein
MPFLNRRILSHPPLPDLAAQASNHSAQVEVPSCSHNSASEDEDGEVPERTVAKAGTRSEDDQDS